VIQGLTLFRLHLGAREREIANYGTPSEMQSDLFRNCSQLALDLAVDGVEFLVGVSGVDQMDSLTHNSSMRRN